jgi:argininosuccinate lyase
MSARKAGRSARKPHGAPGGRPSAKSWQARLTADADEATAALLASIDVDRGLWKYDIAGSLAHAQMLSEEGIISRAEFADIRTALTEIAEKIEAGKLKMPVELEDIHMVVEKALIDAIGATGGKLHTGRSRNDQVALDLRLWARDRIDDLIRAVVVLQRALVALAGDNAELVMPAYTHLQRAQPVLAGHVLLAYVEMLQRDTDRLADARKRVNVCPLGSGAVAGTSLPLNRARTAELLGFPSFTRNSVDATADRDFLAELCFCCAMTCVHLSRWAEDWIIYATAEFGFIELADEFCTSSSMMPQKKNPDTLELIRAKAAGGIAQLTGMLTLLKGLPLAYGRDLQDDKRFATAAVDALGQVLPVAAGIAATTRFNAGRIAAGLDEGYLDATSLAEYLVGKGTPFRRAHQIVGGLVGQAVRDGRKLADLSLDELRAACGEAVGDDVYEHLSAANVVARYAPEGAAGPRQLRTQLDHWTRKLAGR